MKSAPVIGIIEKSSIELQKVSMHLVEALWKKNNSPFSLTIT